MQQITLQELVEKEAAGVTLSDINTHVRTWEGVFSDYDSSSIAKIKRRVALNHFFNRFYKIEKDHTVVDYLRDHTEVICNQ